MFDIFQLVAPWRSSKLRTHSKTDEPKGHRLELTHIPGIAGNFVDIGGFAVASSGVVIFFL
jgi:hypothetical protein